MWSPIKFKLFLKQFKDRKEFLNQPVNSFTQIYQIIAEKLYLSDETVKSWTRNNSNGPGDRDTKEKLAALLNFDVDYFEKKEGNVMNKTVNSNNYDVVDMKIADCIKEVYAFVEVLLANDKEQGIPRVLSNGYTDVINSYCKRLADLSTFLPDDLSAEMQCYASEDELTMLKDMNSAWNNQDNVFDSIYKVVTEAGWYNNTEDGWYNNYDDERSSFAFYPLGNSQPDVEFDDNKIFMLLENNKIFYPFLCDILYNPKIDELDYKQFYNCDDEEIGNLGSLINDIKIFKDYSTFTVANVIMSYIIKSALIIEKLRKQLLSERQEASMDTISARLTNLINESGLLVYSLKWGDDSPFAEFLKNGN